MCVCVCVCVCGCVSVCLPLTSFMTHIEYRASTDHIAPPIMKIVPANALKPNALMPAMKPEKHH